MLEVVCSRFGWAKLSDGTRLGYRVVIVSVRALPDTEDRPIGPEFRIGIVTPVFIEECPEELKDRVKDKPLFTRKPEVLMNPNLWETVDVVESESTVETCLYYARNGRVYSITIEVEPTIVVRTLQFRDEDGNPVYLVRWARKEVVKLVKREG